jgi:hypothetical protein
MHGTIGDYLCSLASAACSPPTAKAACSDLTGFATCFRAGGRQSVGVRSAAHSDGAISLDPLVYGPLVDLGRDVGCRCAINTNRAHMLGGG